jgi:hypothetical protein
MTDKKVSARSGVTHVFSFPFWMCVDTKAQLGVCTAKQGSYTFRIYEPFRSSPANYSPTPRINPRAVPRIPEANPPPAELFLQVGWLPLFSHDGGPGIHACWSERFEETPRIFPMDSLRLDILGDLEALPRPYRHVAFAQRLISRVRHLTGQWWISRSLGGLTAGDGASFDIDTHGSLVGPPHSQRLMHIPFGFELAVDQPIWRRAVHETMAGLQTPPFATSLLDAYFHVATHEVTQSVVAASIGCEQAADLAIKQLWTRRNAGKRYQRKKAIGGKRDLPNNISLDLKRSVGHSFADNSAVDFDLVTSLWIARGKAAHGLDPGVDEEEVIQMLGAAQRLVAWLEARMIDKDNARKVLNGSGICFSSQWSRGFAKRFPRDQATTRERAGCWRANPPGGKPMSTRASLTWWSPNRSPTVL